MPRPTNTDAATPAELGFLMPAEWERHEATWLGWPHHEADWPGKLDAVRWVYGEMVRKISPGEIVRILVRHEAEQKLAASHLKRAGCDSKKIRFIVYPTNRGWLRDSGPIFVRRSVGRDAAPRRPRTARRAVPTKRKYQRGGKQFPPRFLFGTPSTVSASQTAIAKETCRDSARRSARKASFLPEFKCKERSIYDKDALHYWNYEQQTKRSRSVIKFQKKLSVGGRESVYESELLVVHLLGNRRSQCTIVSYHCASA